MQHSSTSSQRLCDVLVATHLRQLRAAARTTNHCERFFLFNTELLAALEAAIEAAGGHGFAAALVAQYRRWQAAMGPRRWREVVAYNDMLGDADRNWLLDALADEDSRAANHTVRANAAQTTTEGRQSTPTHAERQ